jgi:hypothetical protein
MDRVCGIIPVFVRVTEVREILRPGVPVKEYNVRWINRSDRAVNSVVKCNDTSVR